ncbi:unnamed protein product [Microthlaspi erraticum]|uniref:HTH myb-type domain-containing protein n=1 Tax=Microthlaspi erraticum TaxID=1685480 RepID=A0A6D2LEJ2_9BRAS|nr:unnamed protein product [Microthlaspi erraticum]
METFKASQTYPKRASVTNAEWRTKPVCPIATETKRRDEKRVEGNVGRPRSLWTQERHMKFLSALSILGDKDSHPKSILSIMEDQDLTQRQVGSHLQKYKSQVDRLNLSLSRKEWRSTNTTFEYPSGYAYPFNASNLAKNLSASETNTNLMAWLSSGSMVQNDFIHSETNVAISQTNINQTGNTYFGESSNVPQDMVSNNTDSSHMSLVPWGPSYGNYPETNMPVLETTNINHMSWISSEESHALPLNVVSSEANTTQAIVPITSGGALDDDLIVPIEDMISFDSEMDMLPLLEDYGSSEVNINPLFTNFLSNDLTFNTQMDSIFNTSVEGHNQNQREERGDNIGDDVNDESMDWINHVLNDDV